MQTPTSNTRTTALPPPNGDVKKGESSRDLGEPPPIFDFAITFSGYTR
jgi:hypothetical protein